MREVLDHRFLKQHREGMRREVQPTHPAGGLRALRERHRSQRHVGLAWEIKRDVGGHLLDLFGNSKKTRLERGTSAMLLKAGRKNR